jgi:hypothetical protein
MPLLNPGMDAVIGCLKRERAKPPTGMKNHRAGWQREGWNADEDENKYKDCGQNSRTFGASINEASINDHRTPEAAQSQCFGNPNSPAIEHTLTEL